MQLRLPNILSEPYVGLSGPAVEQKLVGIDASEADRYYEICMQSSDEIIEEWVVWFIWCRASKQRRSYRKL